MSCLKNLCKVFGSAVLFAVLGSAGATTISGNFNGHGYDVINIHLAADATVDMQYTGGYYDPVLGLFNADGSHIVTNDDSGSLYSHLTQTLAAGDYSIVATYCCSMVSALPGATYSNSDGFNAGSYWFGGSGTLAGVQAYLDNSSWAAGTAYQFELTNATVSDVPEPQTMALFGVALAALGLARRQRRA